ncbi:hypothetical protein SMSP2_00046 [Limihaloglobus sulfuriphilus]|uniref:Uncharacterized protein n=1 Tax=Limihaloglobus sulfuriphilus TaxID=1851148 RepID=A0A1Q2MAK8_9BACT|nr:symporter small accessory protein [Limihaloglobus sulfuriphilus]AQQ69716.1 hypothetical protein SMSP2_00046 [Limihaloglobus sulfuriphilus]
MFGLEDAGILAAYLLCIVSCLIGVAYGIINWNKGAEPLNAADIEWAHGQKEADEEI